MTEARLTVFLDRDGVINRKPLEGRYVTRWSEFAFLPGSIEALRILRTAGLRLVVVTNQQGVAKGHMTAQDVADIHQRMRSALAAVGADVDLILFCPHEEGSCECRKPRPGLFRLAVDADPAIDLSRAVMVGDSIVDLQAGNALGVPVFLIGSDRQRATILSASPETRVDGTARTLLDLVRAIPSLQTGG